MRSSTPTAAGRAQVDGGPSSRRRQRRRQLACLRTGQILLADRAYDSNALRVAMKEQSAWANVKPVARRIQKPAFSRCLYRYRNLVKRLFDKLKHYRAIAKRYEKHATNLLALVKLAATRIWLRAYESVT